LAATSIAPGTPARCRSHRITSASRWRLLIGLVGCLGLSACRQDRASLPPDDQGASPSQPVHVLAEPWFREVTAELGLEFRHAAFGAETYFFPAIMAPGVALLDFDRDGRLDILVVNGAPLAHLGITATPGTDSRQPPSAGHRLWRQEGDGQFTDVTQTAGLEMPLYGMGIAVGDINNDGYPDLYLSCYGADRLFLNRQDGTFEDITESAGIDNRHWGASAAFFDFDRDGWLDLFVTNYVDYDPGQPCLTGAGQDFCNPAIFPGTPDRLFRNLSGRFARPDDSEETSAAGDASQLAASPGPDRSLGSAQGDAIRFEDVSLSSGIARKPGPGLGVVCADLTGDGWDDIYVANDGHANFLWVNQRDGTFRDEAPLRGVAYDGLGRSQGSMGIGLADVNRDGVFDLLVTNLDGENNALYLSQPGVGFREMSTAGGLGLSYPYTGFGTALVDLNHSGFWEMLVVNGRVRRLAQAASPASRVAGQNENNISAAGSFAWQNYGERNLLFQERREGLFVPVEHPEDPFLASAEASRGLAVGDLDNDGDLDLVLTSSGGTLRVLKNEAPKQGGWLSLRVIDPRYGGRDAYGARVRIVAGARRWLQIVQPGSSYLSSHDPRLHFGLGEVAEIERIEVWWPDGVEEHFSGGPVNEFRTLSYGAGTKP
jgi:enediyne biosynthesis protein E4